MFGIPRNILLLTFLYFIQGLPYGLQVQFLPVYLRQRGVNLSSLSLLRLLHLPWLCKPLWAPLVDKWGTKRQWLVGSVAGLMLTCVLTSLLSPEGGELTATCWLLLLMNLAAATQDIAVDSIAMSLLGPADLGQGNTAQVVGYKLGSVFGGGVIVGLMQPLGWRGLFLALALLYLEALLFVLVSPVVRDLDRNRKLAQQTRRPGDNAEARCDSPVSDCDSVFLDDHPGSSGSEKGGSGASCGARGSADSDLTPEEESNIVGGESKSKVRETRGGESHSDESEADAKSNLFHRKRTKVEHPESAPRSEPKAKVKVVEEGQPHISGDYSGLNFWRTIFNVPGTKWMLLFVLVYKLGEQGALSMLPLLLIDMRVSGEDVTFWNGVIGQAASIGGSVAGGWLIARQRFPVSMLLQQFSLLRLLPVGIQTLVIAYWHEGDYLSALHRYICIGTMVLLMLLGGMVTTVTFTFMMQCSQRAPAAVQATHYTMLTTAEVMGKLLFVAATGHVTEAVGYPLTFLGLILLTAAVIPLFNLDSFPGVSCVKALTTLTTGGDTDSRPASPRGVGGRLHGDLEGRDDIEEEGVDFEDYGGIVDDLDDIDSGSDSSGLNGNAGSDIDSIIPLPCAAVERPIVGH